LKTKTKQPTPYNNDYEPLTLNGKENAGLQIQLQRGRGSGKKGGGNDGSFSILPRNAAEESKQCDSLKITPKEGQAG